MSALKQRKISMTTDRLEQMWLSFEKIHNSVGLTNQEFTSMLVKLFLMINKMQFSLDKISSRIFSLINYLESAEFELVSLIESLEKFSCCNLRLERHIWSSLVDLLVQLSFEQFVNLINHTKNVKAKGQFFTAKKIVSMVSENIFDLDDTNATTKTVIDASAGKGDFLIPFFGKANLIIYSVELDPIYVEFLIFQILLDNSYPVDLKLRNIVNIKHGDAILGYDDKLLYELTSKENGSKLLKKYLLNRKTIVENTKDITLETVIECFKLRKQISQLSSDFKQFNWFIDFPERFLDIELDRLKKGGFDIVIGNPPWIQSKKFDKDKYKEAVSNEIFAEQVFGKYNLALLFLILSYKLSLHKGCLVAPLGVITESYAKKWRKKVIDNRNLYRIILLQKSWFKNVTNEFCLVFWDRNTHKTLQIEQEVSLEKYEIPIDIIQKYGYRFPLIPRVILLDILLLFQKCRKLEDLCFIRRGLTLTKEYQNAFEDSRNDIQRADLIKPLIHHNKSDPSSKQGVFNYQIFHSSQTFVYDRRLLGAPGTSSLFEQPKIIRRNRGRKWILALDKNGKLYVNDIFDMIIPNYNEISLNTLFAYLLSSFAQFFLENILQRDITSNFVRLLPVPELDRSDSECLDSLIVEWFQSEKTLEKTEYMRERVDKIIFRALKLSDKTLQFIRHKSSLNWFG